MSAYVDNLYLTRVSSKLTKFKQKRTDLFNFRCPICGDSQKNKNLARGYIFRKDDDYFYRCHNCSISLNFYGFLERVEPTFLPEYMKDSYQERGLPPPIANTEISVPKDKPVFKKRLKLKTVGSLSDTHPAKQYCVDRMIPEETLHRLYYASDFKKFVSDMGWEKKGLLDDDKRIVIPFYNKEKELVALQGRTITDSKLRYITVKVKEDSNKFFGLDTVDEDEMIYVTEGPIDSLFLDNAISTADSNLFAAERLYDKTKIVLVWDNEPRNKEIVKLLDKAIEMHYNVVIWPEMIKAKDINEMVKDGFDVDEIKDIVEKNTFVNLRAKMEFVNWKKV